MSYNDMLWKLSVSEEKFPLSLIVMTSLQVLPTAYKNYR